MAVPIQMPTGPMSRMASGAAMSTISMGLRKFLVTAGVMRVDPALDVGEAPGHHQGRDDGVGVFHRGHWDQGEGHLLPLGGPPSAR